MLVAEDAALGHRLAESTAALIVALAGDYDHIVAPATTDAKNVLPRVAALLDEELGQFEVAPLVVLADPRARAAVSAEAVSEFLVIGQLLGDGIHRLHDGIAGAE